MLNTPEARFALRAVYQASRLVHAIQQEMVSPAITKQDRSPVTVGDFAAQAIVAQRLANAFPDQPLVAEESAETLRAAENRKTLGRVTEFVRRLIPDADSEKVCHWIALGESDAQGEFWALDPIDGTKGFLRGDQYAVALAQLRDGEVQLGVLGCPSLGADGRPADRRPGVMLLAVRGGGAWSAPLIEESLEDTQRPRPELFRPIRVSSVDGPGDARLLRSVEAGHTSTGGIARLISELGIEAKSVRMDSQAKYAMLASGHADLLVRLLSPSRPDYREKIWDHAAGALIVEEAGGRVSDLAGKPLDFSHGRTLAENVGVVGTNGLLHEAVLAGLGRLG